MTAKYGAALYIHYSGVSNTEAIRKHPSWARINEKGKRDKDNTSVFGPYVDKLLIPQLKELRDEYDIDGVWLDGECWATCQDYSLKVLKAFREQTGIELALEGNSSGKISAWRKKKAEMIVAFEQQNIRRGAK